MNSRNKGKRGELELAAYLRDHGFPEARRGQQYNGADGSADVIGGPEGIHIEVKRAEQVRIQAWMDQADRDRAPGETPVVFHRRNVEMWKATLYASDFLKILKKEEKG